MMPEKSDSFGVNDVSHSYFDNLLKSGVHIYLYRSGFLHSKVVTIDNRKNCLYRLSKHGLSEYGA